MSNYHSDKRILSNVQEHYQESLKYFSESNIVGIFYQGSGNYEVDTENSDTDTRLIVTPSFEEIAFNKKLHSTTHFMDNGEHINFKDIRFLIQEFRKQNPNTLEILFTKYKIENPLYQGQWKRLVRERERIARYSPYIAAKTIKGMLLKLYTSDSIEYSSKQLYHLFRIEEFAEKYINNEPYQVCLKPADPEYLINIKSGVFPTYTLYKPFRDAGIKIVAMIDEFCEKVDKTTDKYVDELFDDVQYSIMKISMKNELLK